MADYCQSFKRDWPIQCNQGCPLMYYEATGTYANLELSIRTDFNSQLNIELLL